MRATTVDQLLVDGLKISAEFRKVVREASKPPMTRTRPSDRRTAECPMRAVLRSPVELHVLVAGLYSSADAKTAVFSPPAMRTRPSASTVVVWTTRPVTRDPAAAQVSGVPVWSLQILA